MIKGDSNQDQPNKRFEFSLHPDGFYPERAPKMGVPRGLHLVGGMAWQETPVTPTGAAGDGLRDGAGSGDQGQPMATRKAKLSQQQKAEGNVFQAQSSI